MTGREDLQRIWSWPKYLYAGKRFLVYSSLYKAKASPCDFWFSGFQNWYLSCLVNPESFLSKQNSRNLKHVCVSTGLSWVVMCVFPDDCGEFSTKLLHHSLLHHAMCFPVCGCIHLHVCWGSCCLLLSGMLVNIHLMRACCHLT